jgi:TraX protein
MTLSFFELSRTAPIAMTVICLPVPVKESPLGSCSNTTLQFHGLSAFGVHTLCEQIDAILARATVLSHRFALLHLPMKRGVRCCRKSLTRREVKDSINEKCNLLKYNSIFYRKVHFDYTNPPSQRFDSCDARVSSLLLWILPLAALVIVNQNFYALLMVPLVYAAQFVDLPVPRCRHVFYVFYPAHLAVLWLAQAWMG